MNDILFLTQVPSSVKWEGYLPLELCYFQNPVKHHFFFQLFKRWTQTESGGINPIQTYLYLAHYLL